ncbi:MAG: DNA gyrase/topoisomerase IV subunit A, partial [Caldilineaceae bacterium]
VEWNPNFDNTLREPDVLPAALPNLLINGSSGIAVGMATNIPPHNLGEVVDALAYMIDHFAEIDEVTVDKLLQFVKGPDFPTGGIVYRYRDDSKPTGVASPHEGEDGKLDVIAQGYSTGRARLIMQAKAHFEEMARGRMRIIVTELPYQTNKTTLLERIADLVRDGKLEGISDLRDESDRTGMRVVIELKRDVDPKIVLRDLYKYTPLQQTFGMQLLSLVDGQPKLLNLKRMLQYFIHHRQEIIRRRSEYDVARARERLHIVEGLLKALDILDEVISTIRRSQTVDTARKNLIANFKFSEVQAQAILDMQLRRLAALERKKLQEEYDELKQRIAWLEELLASPEKVLALIKSDLLAIKEKYADPRRTQIVDLTRGAHTTHDLLPEIEVWLSAAADGTLRRQTVGKQSPAVMRQIGRNADAALLQGNTRDLLYLVTSGGRAARVGIHEVPEEGKQFTDLALFSRNEKLVSALPLPRTAGPAPDGCIFLATEKGMVKRVLLADLVASVNGGTVVIKVEEKDRLGWAFQTRGDQEVLLVTSSGQAIRFAEEEVRSMGLAAAGVGGIKLGKNEKVIYAGAVDVNGSLVTFTAAGFAKLSPLAEYPKQGRNGGGVVAHKLSARTGDLTAATIVPGALAPRWLLLMAGKGAPRVMETAEVPRFARSAQGKQVVEAATAGGPAVVALRFVLNADGGDLPVPPRPRLLDDPPGDDSTGGPSAPPPPTPTRPSPSRSAATPPSETRAAAVKLDVKPVAPASAPGSLDEEKAGERKRAQPKSPVAQITDTGATGGSAEAAEPRPASPASVPPPTAKAPAPSA